MRTVFSRLWTAVSRAGGPGLWPLLAAACLVSALGVQAAGRAGGPGDLVRLESIAGRADRQTASVLIQTSQPVPYVTAQPDPSTVLVDLRNVTTAGVNNRFVSGSSDAVSAVSVEDALSADGVPLARVRVTFAHPLVPRVRSTRNVIRVEVDQRAAASAVSATVSAPAAAAAAPARKPATVLTGVRAVQGPAGPMIVLEGNGALTPGNVELTSEAPYRLVLDFPGVSQAVKASTAVRSDPVERVRVARNSSVPLVTRVVVDLRSPAPYRIDQSQGGVVSIVFGDAARQTDAPEEPSAGPHDPSNGAPIGFDLNELVRKVSEGPPATASPVGTTSSPVGSAIQPGTTAPPVGSELQPGTTRAAAPQSATGQATTPPAPARQDQATIGEKKYTGAPISLDFAGSDIRAVLRVFSEASGLNIIIDPKVQGTVDVALRDVPWDQALDIILKSAALGHTLEGNVVRIAPLDVLANEEKQRRLLSDEQALAGNLETLTRTLSYATAKDMRGILLSSALTKRGQIQVDERTNTLIIRDLPNALPAISEIIDTLDRAQPQVEIEARIVQTTRNFARQLGIKWGFTGRVDPSIGNTTGLAFPNEGSIAGRTAGLSQGVPAAVNLGTTAPATSAVGLSLGAVNGAFNLDVELSALESQGKGRILSTPRVLAQNNFRAEMTQGVQIPIQTIANNTITVTFKDAALKLLVTPQINANQTVILNIELENATPDYTKQINNIPPINTQRAVTQVMTKDNDTLVIGGVFVSREQTQNDHTPGLSKIPLLGWLFRRDSIDDESNELLIFLTPRIIKS